MRACILIVADIPVLVRRELANRTRDPVHKGKGEERMRKLGGSMWRGVRLE